MGQLLAITRLAVRDIRHRPIQAALLLLAITAGAATLTLGLALHGTTNNPYARTRAATDGPDVVVTAFPGGSPAGSGQATPGAGGTAGGTGAAAATLRPLEHAADVVAHSGPFPVTWTLFHDGATTGSAEIEGRSYANSPVDQPKLLTGTWIRPGGVVVEAGFASALGLHVGDRLNLAGLSFTITGTAVTAAIPAYPNTCASAEDAS